MYTIYEACENSDLTEGKGHMVSFAVFDNEADAVAAVHGHGVQGGGTGEVFAVTVMSNLREWADNKKMHPKRVKVWGYRKDWREKWGYGYVDNRDAPTADPEFSEYMRLKEKFGAI